MDTQNPILHSTMPHSRCRRALGVILLAFVLLTAANMLRAQQNIFLSPTVQPVQGGHTQQGNFGLSYTIGEPLQSTLQNGNLMLTQGFEQNEILISNGNAICRMAGDPARGGSIVVCGNCSTTFNSITNPSDLVNDERYLPNSNTVTKQIGINLIFLRNDEGEGGFADDSVTTKYISDAMAAVSWHYNGSNDEDTGQASFCIDGAGRNAKVSFEILHKYYINNSRAWDNKNLQAYFCPEPNTNWYIDSLDAAINADMNYSKGINIYFTEYKNGWEVLAQDTTALATGLSTTSCSQISTCDLSKRLRISMTNYFLEFENLRRTYPLTPANPTDPFFDPSLPLSSWTAPNLNKYWDKVDALAKGLAHEIGHCFFNEIHHIGCNNNLMNMDFMPRNYLRNSDLEEMHQTLSLFSLREYLIGCPYSPSDPYIVATDELIDYDFMTWRDIVIDSGATLTVTCAIRMPAQGKIIVKPGAKLYINGGTITNACDSMWEGIIVQGKKTYVQDFTTTDNATALSTYQGFVYLKNATIENAKEAIRLWNVSEGWVSENVNSTQGGSGGIIRAENTIFKNNRRSAEFMWYHYYAPIPGHPEYLNKSYFKNCQFITDTHYLANEHPFSSHVTLWGVSGVQFTDCYFANNDTRTTDPHLLGNGICSIDASYAVKGGIATAHSDYSNYVETFKNLYNGVLVENSSNTASVDIYDAGFVDNVRGIIMSNSNYSHVNGNIFTVGQMPHGITGANINCVGVAFDNSTQFEHTLNKFNSDNGIDEGAIGSGFFNTSFTGLAENKCEVNDYENLTWANLANLVNRSTGINAGMEGLQFLCNTNTTNDFDFSVYQSYYNNPSDDGVRFLQGTQSLVLPTTAAANLFSTPLTGPNEHQYLSNSYNPIWYYYKTSPQLPQADNVTEGGNGRIQIILAQNNRTCPDNNTGNAGNGCIFCSYSPSEIEQMKEDFGDAFSACETYKTILDSLIDGGNTAQRKMRVDSATSTNRDSVKNELLTVSPYVSQTVLEALLKKYSVFADSVIFQILYANPDAVRNEHFLGEVKKILGQTLTDSLRDRSADTTSRTNLEGTISYYSEQYHQLSRNIITSIQQDTAGFNHFEYRAWLEKLHDHEADYMRVSDYFEAGITDTAMMLLDSIGVRYKMTALQDSGYKIFKELMQFKKDVRDDSLSISHLDSAQVEALDEIAQKEIGVGARQAKAILHFFYGYDYKTELQIPGGGLSGKRDEQGTNVPEPKKIQANTGEVSYLKVFPNPAAQQVTFEYKLPCITGDGMLIVADLNGRALINTLVKTDEKQKTCNTQNWTNGVYIYKMSCNGKLVGNGKLVIAK